MVKIHFLSNPWWRTGINIGILISTVLNPNTRSAFSRQKYTRGRIVGWTWKISLDISPISLLIFHGMNSLKSRFSTPINIDVLWFWNEATYLNSKQRSETPMIGLYIFYKFDIRDHSALRSEWYKIAFCVNNWAWKICWIINNSATDGQIVLKNRKWGVQYWFEKAANG